MSIQRFNVAEILDIAIRIEQNGNAFYRKAAALRKPGEDRDFMLGLAKMEEDHEKTFRNIRNTLPENTNNAEPALDEESRLYLEAMADYHGGEGGVPAADMLTGNETPADILRIAIDLEMKSILYYGELRLWVPPSSGRELVDEVIAEERRHVTALQTRLRRL